MMRHRMFTILAALSFLLCAYSVERAVSDSHLYAFTLMRRGQSHRLVSLEGTDFWIGNGFGFEWPPHSGPPVVERVNRHEQVAGFHYVDSPSYGMLLIPYWFAVTMTAILPLIWLPTFLRRPYRARANLCTTCGYDLRATPSRCPECGAVRTEKIKNST